MRAFLTAVVDIVERFQLSLMLCIIAIRNLIELSGSTFSLLPTSFIPVMPSLTLLQSIFSPALIVILSEMLVDWLKHAFITKFNHSEQILSASNPKLTAMFSPACGIRPLH